MAPDRLWVLQHGPKLILEVFESRGSVGLPQHDRSIGQVWTDSFAFWESALGEPRRCREFGRGIQSWLG
jgi:hypothetical protein